MQIREFRERNTKELIWVWNQTLTKDLICEKNFKRKVLDDENMDKKLMLVAEANQKIVGFILAVKRKVPYLQRGLEPDVAWITALGVLPAYRGMGIADTLLTEMEIRLSDYGAKKIVLGNYTPNYFMPGVDIVNYPCAEFLLEKHDYMRRERGLSMYRNLFGYEIPKHIEEKQYKAEGNHYQFIKYKSIYENKFMKFMENNFSADWFYFAKKLIEEEKAEAYIWLCISPEDQVVGYAQRGIDDNRTRFGPFGVEEKYRDQSIGSILIANMMFDMASQGIYLIYFMTTDEPGARFYTKHGFLSLREFFQYRKELES